MSCLLEGLEPKLVWQIFEKITRIPRCSKHEEKLQEFFKEWAKEQKLSYKKDAVGNVLLTRKAAPGYENAPVLMFQAHQDMICEKTTESSHNFKNDPIPLTIDTGKVSAHITSLSADNGLGIALAMAVLIDKKLKSNGKLEALFTVDKEAGFTGVKNLKPDFFTAKYMINLDSEKAGVIIVSSAGSGETTYRLGFRPRTPDRKEAIRVSVNGLLGGHSGSDIDLPRYNANKLLAECLCKLHSELTIRLIYFEGGSRSKVIPSNSYADVLIPFKRTKQAIEIIMDWIKNIDKTNERNLIVKVNPIDSRPAAPIYETEQVLNIIANIPFGVKSWSPDYPRLVQTSNNNWLVRTQDHAFIIHVSSLTSDFKDRYNNRRILYELGQKYHAKIKQQNISASWKASTNSKLLQLIEKSYTEVLGNRPKITGIHADLECGFIAQLKKNIDIVSVGPIIKHPHSPSGCAEVQGVDTLFETLCNVASKMHSLTSSPS